MSPSFEGTGEIRELLRTRDWLSTPLGDLAQWPTTLLGYVEMILAMPTPAIIFWGPEQTQIYNDGYAVIMGPRHPTYFGEPYRACWPDTFAAIRPHMARVLEGGVATFEQTLFTLTRHGFTEEAYFTFTFSPLRDDRGLIQGILQPVVEVTSAVLQERRARTLACFREPSVEPQAMVDVALSAFAANAEDVPFSAVLLETEGSARLVLAGASLELSAAARESLTTLVREAQEAREPREIRLTSIVAQVPSPWGDPVERAFVVPIARTAATSTCGALVFGISPRLRFDEAYRAFLVAAAASFAQARDREILVERERDVRRDLERQKEHLALLFTRAPVPICVLRGERHVIELANERMCELWGRTREEVLGRPLLDALPEAVEQGIDTLLDEVVKTGRPFVGREVEAVRRGPRDGGPTSLVLNFSYEPIPGVSGGPSGVLVVAIDVTEDVRAREQIARMRDQAERENRSKDEFLAMLGHELRNPLSPLVTSLHLVRTVATPAMTRYLDVMDRQARNLRRIVDDLLEVSRVTQGKIELRKERVDVATIVERALESASDVLKARRHRVAVERPAEPVWILADPVRLEQIVVNLLLNAAKYTEPGGHVTVTVATAPAWARIRVRDDGIGIPEELRARLFDLFQQGARDSARVQGGIGAGLTIVKRLVELHGGRIEAHSDGVGEGSEFVVELPADEAHLSAAEAPITPVPTPPPVGHGRRRILVVDDNEDAAETLAMALQVLGHETRTVFDGPAAIAACDAWKPDLMFVDIGLPGFDGYEVARRVRQSTEPRPLLVAVTGYGQESDKRRAREAGFAEHLVKPVPFEAVEQLVARVTAPA